MRLITHLFGHFQFGEPSSKYLGDLVVRDGLHADWFRCSESHAHILEYFIGADVPSLRRYF